MKVIIGEGDLPRGSGWLPTHLDGLLLLMALYYSIWLHMAHMAQYKSNWSIWIYMALCGQYGLM